MFQINLEDGQNVLLLTSARSGEGVTTVARKLARGLSLDRGRTVLVDSNLRSRSDAPARDAEPVLGVTDILEDNVPLDAVIRPGSDRDPAFVPAGRGVAHTTGLITSPEFRTCVQTLKDTYDWVVLDGPPVTTSPEVLELGRIADAVILVVRAERTRAEVVEEAKSRLLRSGGNVVGAILNDRKYHVPSMLYRLLK